MGHRHMGRLGKKMLRVSVEREEGGSAELGEGVGWCRGERTYSLLRELLLLKKGIPLA